MAIGMEVSTYSKARSSESIDSELTIRITVKTQQDTKIVEVSADAGTKELKEATAREFGVTSDRLCFTYDGKDLPDIDLLASNGIKNGSTVHLVIRDIKSSRWGKFAVIAAGALLAPVVVTVGIQAVGFGAGGVVAGSIAAAMQPAQIASGSAFAILQSCGAAGTSLSTKLITGMLGAKVAQRLSKAYNGEPSGESKGESPGEGSGEGGKAP